jgi:hypothetical protein
MAKKDRLRKTEINPEAAFEVAERGRRGLTAEDDLRALLAWYQAMLDEMLPEIADPAEAEEFAQRMSALIHDIRDFGPDAKRWLNRQGVTDEIGEVIAGVIADAASYGITLAAIGAEAKTRPVVPQVAFALAERSKRRRWARQRWADADRPSEHERWRAEAERIAADAHRNGEGELSKLELSRRVQAALGLTESIHTIRKKI